MHPSIELRHLRYFLVLADELHFGRAAGRLRIAQPALSQQIVRLESLVGTELFSRTRREVRITPAGEALRPFAERAIADAEAGARAALRAAAGEVGQLTIGFIETAASRLVPLAVRRFRADRPDVGLTLLELGVEEQLERLRAGRLDIGIVRPPIDTERLTPTEVASEELVAALPSGHELASRKRLSPKTVTNAPLVALAREVVPGAYDQLLALRQESGGTGAIEQEATSVQAVLGLVAAGLGVAVFPASVRHLSREGVTFVPITSSRRSKMLLVHREDDTSPLVHAFIGSARQED